MGGSGSKKQDQPKATATVPEKEETNNAKVQSEEELIEEVLEAIEESPEEPEIEQVLEKVPEGDNFVDTELEQGIDKLDTPLTEDNYPPPPGPHETHRIRIIERGYGKTRIEDSDVGTKDTPYIYKSFEGDPSFNAGVAKALQCVNHKAPTYEALLNDLTSSLNSDKEKVIAIAAWISQQNIGRRKDLGKEQDSTPKGYMKLIQAGQGTFAAFFAILCRKIDIHCVIVQGYAKTATYDVGELDEERLKSFKNSWNVVNCDGAWCIIHPLLVCKSLVKLRRSGYVVARSNWEITTSDQSPGGVLNSPFNGYYMFTNPSEFVQRFIPVEEQTQWQLLREPSTFEKFKTDVFITPEFYKQNLTQGNYTTCILESSNGICNIRIGVPSDRSDRFLATFDLDIESKDSGNTGGYSGQNDPGTGYSSEETEDKNVKGTNGLSKEYLQRCVIMSRYGGFHKGVEFEIRFPKEGTYLMNIFGGDRKIWNEDPPLLCSFKLVCEKVNSNIQKDLNFDPGLFGWGPGPMTRRAGFLMPSHETGIIKLAKDEQVFFHFQVISRKFIFVAMPQRDKSNDELKNCFSFEEVRFEHTDRRELLVIASVPKGEEEYTLRIAISEQRNAAEKDFICNYLLSTSSEIRRELLQSASTYIHHADDGIRLQRKGQLTVGKSSCLSYNFVQSFPTRSVRAKPKQKETRRELRKIHVSLDLPTLKSYIERAEMFQMDPNDEDVLRVKRRIQFLETTAVLKEARERNNIGFSRKAIKKIESTPFAGILRSDMDYVKKMMQKQMDRGGWRHEVPTVHPDDLAQIVRMQHPQQVIQDIMNAVCHLLGERPKEPKENEKKSLWNKIQVILRFPVKTVERMKSLEMDIKHNGKRLGPRTRKKVQELLDGISVDKLRHVDNSLVAYFTWAKDIVDHAEAAVQSPAYTPEPLTPKGK